MSHKQGHALPAFDRPKNLARPPAAPSASDRGWYRFTNHDTGTADLFIYDEIGMWGVSASDFLNDLSAVTATSINVRINSPGGDVFDGIAIYNALLSHPASVDTTVDSLAASAASFIAMAGDTVTMMPHSQLMIHDAKMMMFGAFNPADLRDIAELLDRQSDNIAAIYADVASGSVAEWRTAMQDETWYTAQAAVDAGLATKVAPKAARSDPAESGNFGAGEPAAGDAASTEDSAAAAAPTFDPGNFREALQIAARHRPAAHSGPGNLAGQLRSALKGATK
jgi:ATP-dependent protease ClpP protease subunit